MSEGKTIPVIEIFGPVIQGEGMLAGQQTYFLRLGGCDYRCSWCDSLYAVLPGEVSANAKRMTENEIFSELQGIDADRKLKTLTISGGNPAMHSIDFLVSMLKDAGWQLFVETQGTLWKSWLGECQVITISPKGPSSGMKTDWDALRSMVKQLELVNRPMIVIKVVVFDDADFAYAVNVFHQFHEWPCYIQPGTLMTTETPEEVRNDVMVRTKWCINKLMETEGLNHVNVMPQVHALIYGHQRGI